MVMNIDGYKMVGLDLFQMPCPRSQPGDFSQNDMRCVLRCVLSPPAANSIRIAHSLTRFNFDYIKLTMQDRLGMSNGDLEAVEVMDMLGEIESAFEAIRVANQRGVKRKRKDSVTVTIEARTEAEPLLLHAPDGNFDTPLQEAQATSWEDRRWKPLMEIVHSCGMPEGTFSELEDTTDRDLAGMEDDESKLINYVFICLSNALRYATQRLR